MVDPKKEGCVTPAAGATGTPPAAIIAPETTHAGVRMQAQVGKPAPDFEAPAYHRGKFITVKLSDYNGKWLLVCFYPGDFTFV